MSRFLSKMVLEEADWNDDGIWRLHAALEYESDFLKCTIVVPKGFLTDLNSSPLLSKLERLGASAIVEAAVIHDYLYSIEAVPLVSRTQADSVLKEAAQLLGASRFSSWWTHLGVRIFGGAYYKKNAPTI